MIERDGAVMITGGSSDRHGDRRFGPVPRRRKSSSWRRSTHGDETTNQTATSTRSAATSTRYMSAHAMARTLSRKYGTGTWFYITADYAWGHSVYDNLTRSPRAQGRERRSKNVLMPARHDRLLVGALPSASGQARRAGASPSSARDMVNCLNQAAQFGLTKSSQDPRAAGRRIHGQRHQGQLRQRRHRRRRSTGSTTREVPGGEEFVDALHDRVRPPPSNGAECAYVNMYQYKQAVERAGSTDRPS